MKFSKILTRTLLNMGIILLAFLIQTSILSMLPFYSVPNLLLILTFSFGFIYGSTQGMLCGLFAGFLMDCFYTVPLGCFMLIFTIIGFLNGLFTNFYYDDYITLPVVLCIVSELLYNASVLLIRIFTLGSYDIGQAFLQIILPEMLFSLMITLLLYRVFLHANRSLDLSQDKRGQQVA